MTPREAAVALHRLDDLGSLALDGISPNGRFEPAKRDKLLEIQWSG